jgi:hypothetical protein
LSVCVGRNLTLQLPLGGWATTALRLSGCRRLSLSASFNFM